MKILMELMTTQVYVGFGCWLVGLTSFFGSATSKIPFQWDSSAMMAVCCLSWQTDIPIQEDPHLDLGLDRLTPSGTSFDTDNGVSTAASSIEKGPPNIITTAEGLRESIVGEQSLTLWHVVQVIAITAIILIGYSLVMSGKRGNGWQIILFFAVASTMLGKFFVSLFNEVTSDNETSDWEDD